MAQLEVPRFVGEGQRADRHHHTQGKRFARRGIDCGVAAVDPCLTQRLCARNLRVKLGHVLAGACHDPAVTGNDHGFLHARLLAQAVEKHDLVGLLAVGQLQRHGMPLDVQLGEHLINRPLGERDPAF